MFYFFIILFCCVGREAGSAGFLKLVVADGIK
jgi:hypothetical protein